MEEKISLDKVVEGEQVFKELVKPPVYNTFTVKMLDAQIASLQKQVDRFTLMLNEVKAKRASATLLTAEVIK